MAIAAPVAIVTGGSRGIGLSIAAHLSARGWAVVLVARDQARLRAAHEQLSSAGGRVATVACDLAASASTATVLDAGRRLGADIDVLVNAAGIFGPVGYMSQTDPVEWATVMDVNFMAALRLSLAVVPAMLRAAAGAASSTWRRPRSCIRPIPWSRPTPPARSPWPPRAGPWPPK